MKETDCKLCNLAGDDRRSVNVTVNPALLCYRHQPAWTPTRDRPRPPAGDDEGDG